MSKEEKVLWLEQKHKTLQMFYAAALADSTLRYGKAGILDEVAAQKKAEQMRTGAALAERFGVKEPQDAFLKTADTYGCADWVCEKTNDGFVVTASRCMLCAISKKMGEYSPCKIHCLSPMEAMLKGVAPEAEFMVEETLWDSDRCKVCIHVN
ncbi:MAG: hypothetical protein FWG53_02035 [Clostridiales bacterium]|nr:hypothetical protein [Clostridiales bacterium]